MKVQKKLILPIILILLGSLYSIVYFRNAQTIYSTGDLSFHLSRIKSLSSIFSGPIDYSTFNFTGYGVNYFYPFLTFFPSVFFYWITNNLILSYVLYVWLLNVCTILIIFYYGKKFLKHTGAAFLLSCVYTFSAYRTINIYHRSAIAEAIAMTIVPVVLYYAYKIIFENEKKYIGLSISMSLLVYTHVLSTLMCSAVIAVFIVTKIISGKVDRKTFLEMIKEMAKAVVGTGILSIYFWYPMLQQMLYQQINRPGKTDLQSKAFTLSDSLINAMNNDLTTYTMGIVGIMSLILPLIFIKLLNKREKFVYYSTVVTWLLTTTFFPWILVQETPLNLIQFPWRILGLQAFFGSLILVMLYSKSEKRKKNQVVWITLAVISLLFLSIATKRNYSAKIQDFPGHIRVDKESIKEYTTKGMDYFLYDYSPVAALTYREQIRNREIKVGNDWKESLYEATEDHITFKVQSANKQTIQLPVYAYIGTKALVNGKEVTSSINQEGLVTVVGTRGTNTIKVYTNYTFTSIIAFIISLSGYLLLLVRLLVSKSAGSKKKLNHSVIK
ncbi:MULTISPECIES: hypothetical protein [unclassified Enterococcus]|jgi:hypothetical protein|uniref:hypothetical protein n=1 Tax=unclassified Enterococcus TaxID=2608891 RepID=UPI003D2A4BF3